VPTPVPSGRLSPSVAPFISQVTVRQAITRFARHRERSSPIRAPAGGRPQKCPLIWTRVHISGHHARFLRRPKKCVDTAPRGHIMHSWTEGHGSLWAALSSDGGAVRWLSAKHEHAASSMHWKAT
jgi:hypothetical protein